MRILEAVLMVAALLVTAGSLPADEQPQFVMRSAENYSDDQATFQIIGGTKSDPADWPATFVFSDQCTSTVVGPRVVLTAAHCVADGAKGTIEVANQTEWVTCSHHPDYRDDVAKDDPDWYKKASPDFALCSVAAPLPELPFENINKDSGRLAKGQKMRLVGFGCNEKGGSDGGFGVLYEGVATIHKLPAPPSYYTVTLGGAAVCYGDSGGGVYLILDPNEVRRFVMGVTSRGDISTESLLSTTSVGGFVSWAESWAAARNLKICGMDDDTTGCKPR